MNNNNNNAGSNAEIGITGLLTIVFVVLKLWGVISWSWLWVLSPLWINAGIIILTIFIYVLIKEVIKEVNKH